MNRFLLCCLLAILIFAGVQSATAQPSATPAANAVSSERAHSVLNKVLQRGEFRTYSEKGFDSTKENSLQRWWKRWWKRHAADIQRMMNKLQKWLNNLFAKMPRLNTDKLGAVGLWVRYLIIGILLAIVLLLLSLFIKSMLLRNEKRRFKDDTGANSTTTRTRKIEPIGWDKALLEAEALWHVGKEREALHTLQLACLTLLDMRGILRYDESRANGEVLRELRRHGHLTLRGALSPIVNSFDKCWYGLLPVSEEEFAQTLAQSRNFRDMMIGGQDA